MYQDQSGQWFDDNGTPIATPNPQATGNQPPAAAPQSSLFIPSPGYENPPQPPTTTDPSQGFTTGVQLPGGNPLIIQSPPQQTLQQPQQTQGAYPQTIAPFSGANYPQFTPPPLPAELQKPFNLPTAQDLMQNDPGYMARYQQGLDAQQRSAAAQGTLLSGGTLKALTNYGQDYASNEYNNYVQQKLGERQQQAGDYLSLAYGPAWQQNQAAVNQYGQLYNQYKDLIGSNRQASQDYITALENQQRMGVGAAGGAPAPAGGTGTGL